MYSRARLSCAPKTLNFEHETTEYDYWSFPKPCKQCENKKLKIKSRANFGSANGDGQTDSADAGTLIGYEIGLDVPQHVGTMNVYSDACTSAMGGARARGGEPVPPGEVTRWRSLAGSSSLSSAMRAAPRAVCRVWRARS